MFVRYGILLADFGHTIQHFQFQAAGFVPKTVVEVGLVDMDEMNGCDTVK